MNSQDRRIGMIFATTAEERRPAMWKAFAESMDPDTIERFIDNLMNISIIVEHVFKAEHPKEYKAWCSKNDYEGIADEG